MADSRRSKSQRMREDLDSLFDSDRSKRKREQLTVFSEKADAANKARAEKRKAAAAKRKEKMEKITADSAKRKEKAKTTFPLVGPTKQQKKPTKPEPTKPKPTGVGGNLASQKDVRPKKKFNVGVSKGGVPFKEAFKHFKDKGQKEFTWNGKKYSTATATPKKTGAGKAATGKAAPKRRRGIVGGIKTVLLGKDQKFGGDRGLIDFLPGESRKKKPVKKMGGGMMKSKMASKGGARGGKKMMPGGMKAGGLAMTTVNGRKVPAFAADGKGPNDLAKKQAGGMMKSKMASKGGAKGGRRPGGMQAGGMMKSKMASKGGAKGGRMPGGMKNGGMAKKGYSKGGAVRRGKPRGVGVALRGYGKALKK
jgi:hypothetical protein